MLVVPASAQIESPHETLQATAVNVSFGDRWCPDFLSRAYMKQHHPPSSGTKGDEPITEDLAACLAVTRRSRSRFILSSSQVCTASSKWYILLQNFSSAWRALVWHRNPAKLLWRQAHGKLPPILCVGRGRPQIHRRDFPGASESLPWVMNKRIAGWTIIPSV